MSETRKTSTTFPFQRVSYPPQQMRSRRPVHVPQHWILLVLDMVEEKFYIFNSLKDQVFYRDVVPLIQYLEGLYLSRWELDVSKFRLVEHEKRPLQLNGLFVLKEMDYLARDIPAEFTQADLELMRGQLLEDFLEGRCGTVVNM
ncbi:putative ubiquitin-like-specific protease 1B [Tasmannia lanceolata]|uniref:putative ubiquitin-like-specific protease 1B n=1 Tax=Tasmannia lanceolata TaxID=3420 RepID=UPI004063CD3E